MRQLKWVGLAFVLGLFVMLNPSHSPAQFGRKGGFGGGEGGFGKGGGKGGFGGGEGGFGRRGGFGSAPQPGGFGSAPQPGGFGSAPQPGGFGATPAPGGFGSGPQPGGFGGGPGGGGFGGQPGGGFGRGGFGSDPSAMWDRFSQGQASINLNDPQNSRMRGMMERMNVPVPPDGVVTREMFITARNASSGGPGGPAPGGPMVVTIGGAPGGPASPGGPMGGNFGGPMGGGGDRDRGAERLREQDKNNDGRVSREEADRQLQPNFERIDVDRDGSITLEEYRGYYANRDGGGRDGGGRDRGMGPGGWAGPMGDPNFGGGGWGGGNFDPRRPTEEPKPVAMRYGHLPKDLPNWFDGDDANMDGQVALHEWRLAGKDIKEFFTYDLNGDGLITADEYLRFGNLQAEEARIAALKDPENAGNYRPSFAARGGNGGFSLPGSTPSTYTGTDRPQGKGGDRQFGGDRQGKGGDWPQGKGGDRQGKGGDRAQGTNEERAPDGGNGGQNPFRRSRN